MGRRITVCEMLFGSIDKLNELLAKHRLMRMFVAGGVNSSYLQRYQLGYGCRHRQRF